MNPKPSPFHPKFAFLRRTKILSLVFGLLSFIFYPLSSQIPQGFNYQAIARDAGGNLITTAFDIKVEIQNLAADTVFWIEEHTVTPNEYGLISFVVGQSGRIGGTALLFEDIDWASHPRYLKTSANTGSGYTVMGIAQIMSVPYSLVAKEVTGPVENLNIVGTTEDMDEALFEVRNKDGQVIFAVYNEGVRIYVDDEAKGPKGGFAIGSFGINKEGESQPYFIVKPDTVRIYINQSGKGVKGGFAIGGYGIDKTEPQNFLFVSDDSVRIYIDSAEDDYPKGVKGGFAIGGYGYTKGGQKLMTVSDDSVRIYIDDGGKGPKGGFAIGGFDKTKGEGNNANFFNVSTNAQDTIDPAQNRILWYPVKNAFLTGKVLVELPDSVGENSFASGYESKAIGRYSQALGYQAIARKDYSTAIGYQAVANKINSFAFGQWALAKNEESYAFGRGAIAEGFRSFAFGSAGVDSAGAATGVAFAKGDYSFAIGQGSQALGKGSFALGVADTARGEFSLATGYSTTASGNNSTAMGRGATASGSSSIAMGYYTKASGLNSTAMGYHTTASGSLSTAMGGQTTASGVRSTAMGYHTTASGHWSTAMGYFTKALGLYSTAMGWSTTASAMSSTAMGDQTTASGVWSTAMGYHTTASGSPSTAMGANTTAWGSASTAMGWETTSSGDYSTAMGRQTTASGLYSTAMGYQTKANTCSMVTVGMYNDTTKYNGDTSYNTWYSSDPLFVIGKGTSDTDRSNAVTVLKNGNIGIGTIAPVSKLDIEYKDLLGTTTGNNSPWQRLYGWAGNCDQLRIFHRRFTAGSDWNTAEIRIQKTVDVDDKGYLSFKADYLELGIASSPMLTIRSSGNIGIGISNPVSKLDINGRARFYNGGDTPGILLMNAANTSDEVFVGMYDDNNFGILDIGTAWRLIINNTTGNVGIGTTSPLNKLSVAGTRSNTVNSANAIAHIGGGDVFTYFGALDGSPSWNTWIQPLRSTDNVPFGMLLCPVGGNVGIGTDSPAYKLQVGTAGDGTQARANAWNLLSDIRLKTSLIEPENPIKMVEDISGYYFYWKEGSDKTRQFGFNAQEVNKVLPEIVSKGDDGLLSLDYGKITPLLVEAIKEQQQQIDTQNQKIDQLIVLIDELKKEIASSSR